MGHNKDVVFAWGGGGGLGWVVCHIPNRIMEEVLDTISMGSSHPIKRVLRP